MKRSLFLCLVAMFALLSVNIPMMAQGNNTGCLEGRVIDDQGGPIPGAEVKVSSPALIGGPQSRMTTNDGNYRFVLLPPGIYTLEATLTGFAPARVANIRLFVAQTLTINIPMKVGTLDTEITVVARTPLVGIKSSQTLSTNLDQTVFETVAATKSKLSTGLINLAPAASDNSVMEGSARSSNSWLMDGMNLTWLANGADGNCPDLTTIQEVQISGVGANAEFGNFTRASLNLLQIHGSVELPLGFSFSPRLSVRSGNPWTRNVKLNHSGSLLVFVESRGNQRLPTRIDLDFRLGKFSGSEKGCVTASSSTSSTLSTEGSKLECIRPLRHHISATPQPSPMDATCVSAQGCCFRRQGQVMMNRGEARPLPCSRSTPAENC